ncbi:MAG: FtsX-like permease family protein, partial [Terracoccus sp.]
MVLTGSAQQSRLEVTATVDANYRSSYDILVRPKQSKTPIEASTGRVRPNYLSGLYGGITTAQSDAVGKVSGVEISAPIAMVGQVFQSVDVPVDITDLVGDAGPALVRLSSSEASMRGLATTPGPAGYVYVGDGVKLDLNSDDTPVLEKQGPRSVPVCQDLRRGTQAGSPFDRQNTWDPTCYDRNTGRSGMDWPQQPGRFLATVRMSFPVTIAAIDPVAEAALTGLDKAMVSGRYLQADDAAATVENQLSVPMLASSRSLVDQVDTVKLDKLDAAAVASLRQGPSREAARTMIEAARPVSSRSVTITAAQAHAVWVEGRDRGPGQKGIIYPLALFAPTPVTYDQSGGGPLRPRPVKVDPTVWLSTVFVNVPFVAAPAAATDTGYRDSAPAPAVGGNDADYTPLLRTYGTFDPTKIRSFSELSKLPLETYQPPVVTGSDAATRTLLHGKTLAPDANPSGYVQNPPLLLTTLKALPTLMSSRAFDWPADSKTPTAPISAVRVRVAGVTGADPASRERIRLTAERIVKATGLDVDITVGSSPRPTPVQLPSTAHGAPPLLVTENWVQKGVAATITTAVDRKSLTLFILILVTTALAVSISANASVRSRRTELGVLACIGWRPALLTRTVLGELLTIGALAGVIGALVAVPVGAAFGTQVPFTRAALAVPAAIVLTVLAGLIPALRAARATPADAVRPAVTEKGRFRVRLRGPASMAVNYVARTPARAVTGAIALAMGVAALTALTGITVAFQ